MAARTQSKKKDTPRVGNGNWQAEKSQKTREAVMEAAIKCFIELGYTDTTTSSICEKAGVSRGAMMHHFASRADVIDAAVHYLHDKRLAEFRKLMSSIATTMDDSQGLTEQSMRDTVNLTWKFFNLPSFTAYHELAVAARSNRDLEKVMIPIQQAFEQELAEAITSLFPVWEEMEEIREQLTDLVFFTLQGMATSYMRKHKKERINRVLDSLASHALDEYTAALQAAEA